MSANSVGPGGKSAKAYSCVRCFERKVKCDRESPCSNCSRGNYECIFRIPPAPRRRKKRTQEEILKARLDRYEKLLKEKGVDVHADPGRIEDPDDDDDSPPVNRMASTRIGDTPSSTSGATSTKVAFPAGRLIVDQGRSRFVENGLWTAVSEELRKPSEAMNGSDTDEDSEPQEDSPDFILGLTPSSPRVHELHPDPQQLSCLWQAFLENVNPLTKLIHPPSLQPRIFEAASNHDKVSKNLEVLMFSIYTISVLSLTAEECEEKLNENRETLLTRYRAGTKRALARARFMGTSDVIVLQAFVLHLLAMRDVYDSRTLWTLTGVAHRIAEGLGVHRDGSNLGLNPFQTEMRRRLWWQVLMLDFRTAELSGSGRNMNYSSCDVQLPTNVNDADLQPDMKEPPTPSPRQTEMIFCLTRYETANFWKMKLLAKSPDKEFSAAWFGLKNHWNVEQKERAILELEQILEQKYVRFCDPSVPVEFMAMIVARAATKSMRMMARHPRRYEKNEDIPDSERKLTWELALKLVETDNIVKGSRQMKRFKWHTDHYFQWSAFVFILDELRQNPMSDHAEMGWQRVNEIVKNHPELVYKMKKPGFLTEPIYLAVGNLILTAWKSRALAQADQPFGLVIREPPYIQDMLNQRRSVQVNSQHTTNMRSFVSPADSNNYFGTPAEAHTGGNTSIQNVHMPTNEQLQLQQTIRQMQFNSLTQHGPLADVQQPQHFWWDYNNTGMVGNMNMDFDMNSLGGPMQDVPMDWSQWDLLLKDVRPGG